MKNACAIAGALIILFTSCAQKLNPSKIPEKVRASCIEHYPHTAVTWEKENSNFEAVFTYHNQKMSAIFKADGTLVENETIIANTGLPVKALKYLERTYHGEKISEAARITKVNGMVSYEAQIAGKEVLFDETGKILKVLKD